MEIRYRYFDNADSMFNVSEVLEPLRFLIPSWVKVLYVDKYQSSNNSLMEIEPNKAYRFAQLSIYDRFFQQDRKDMRRFMIHELLHIHHNVICQHVRGSLIPFIQKNNDALSGVLEQQYNDRMEGFIEDFSYVIDGLLPTVGDDPSS